jgi:hypothetical protein
LKGNTMTKKSLLLMLLLAACSERGGGVHPTGLSLSYADDLDAGVRCYMWSTLSGDSISCVRTGVAP